MVSEITILENLGNIMFPYRFGDITTMEWWDNLYLNEGEGRHLFFYHHYPLTELHVKALLHSYVEYPISFLL